MKFLRRTFLTALLGLVLATVAPSTLLASTTSGTPSPDLSLAFAPDRWLRGRVGDPGGELIIETSYAPNPNNYWYGTSLGGSNIVPGSIRITVAGSRFLATIVNTQGQVWGKWYDVANSGNGDGSLAGWFKLPGQP